MKNNFFHKFLLVALALLLGACSVVLASPEPVTSSTATPSQPDTNTVNVKAVQSNLPREAAPQVAEEDQAQLAQGNSEFAFNLYNQLRAAEEGNLFYSPYSISLALGMTFAGARGSTAEQMTEALSFTLPADRLHPAFNALDQELASRKDQPGQGADGKGFRLNIVNDLWGQQEYSFLPEFLDLLAKNYGAGLRLLDFQANPEGARQEINDYIAEQTEQRIQDLIPQGAIDPLTRLVLTNAIYFNAAWLHPFNEELTENGPFTLVDGTQVEAPMMLLPGEDLLYAKGEGYQAVVLPYENNDLGILILVPDEGGFEEFEAGLDAAQLDRIQDELQYELVTVKMPGFTFESDFPLSEQLTNLGMQDAFAPGTADLSGMDGTRDLFISEVIHKAFVKVDEAGTEAAAATAVIVGVTSAPMDEPIQLTIDRPFIFLIVDKPTDTILFLGRLMDPR